MIKIFDANDRDFSTAGNIIIEPTKCREFKKKSLNGWYIEVEIPINYKEYIEKDKLCVIKTKSKLNPQAFRIADNIKYTNRKISFTAEHVMFDSRNYLLLDVRPTNLNGTNALNYINERTDNVSPFTMFSNIENVNTAYFIRKNLLEAWTTIEERWNGVFDADNWNISFLQSVGNDNGETIIYGKNMQSMEIYEDWSSVVTKLYPVGYDGLMLSEQYLESNIKYEVPYTRTIDFQTDLEQEEQTQENLISELRQKAQKYLDENKYPKVSYTTVSNINDNMEIGDIIQVLHPLVTIKTEVLEYEYDVISKKIKSLTFGNFSRDVKTKFDSIKSSIYSISQTLSKQQITIKNQTDLINSLNKNGYVYIDDNEILILDKLPKEEAKNVWRFGLGGIGFSSNGYEGPFETAITMDGQINAKFITTGTMSVARIEGLADELSGMKSAIELNNQNIIARVETQEETIEKVQQQTNLNTDEIAKLGSTETIEGEELKVNASNNPAKLYVHGNTEQATRAGINQLMSFSKGETDYFADIANKSNSSTDYWKAEPLADNWIHMECDCTTATDTQRYINTYIAPDKIPNLKASTQYTIAIEFRNVNITTMTGPLNIGRTHGSNDNIFNGILTLEKATFEAANNGIRKYILKTTATPSGTYAFRNFHTVNQGDKFSYDYRISVLEGDYRNVDYTYEPYGVMPSPDYPSDIRNVGDNINKLKNELTNQILGGINVKIENDESITLNGTSTTSFYLVVTTQNFDNETITFSSWFSGNVQYSNNNKLYIVSNPNDLDIGINDIDTYRTVTLTKNKDWGNIRIWVPSGTTFNDYNIKLKIEKGPIGTGYNKYNCGSVDIKLKNKNFCEFKIGTPASASATIVNDKLIIKPLVTSGVAYVLLQYREYKIGKKYTISFKYEGNYKQAGLFSGPYTLDKAWTSTNYAFTLQEGNNTNLALGFYVDVSSLDNELIIYDIQIEEGEVATDYVEHQEQIVSFSLAEGQVLHKGDYLAEDGIHQNKGTLVLDGTEEWLLSTSGNFYIQGKSYKTYADGGTCISTHFPYGFNLDNHIWIGNADFIIIRDTRYTTVKDFKTYLEEQYANGTPVTVEYELAEEIVIPYTPEQQKVLDSIETFKGINHIYCIDEITPERIILEYYPNTLYNDTLVNKDTFDKVTTEMNTEFNIRANEIETSVKESTTASILTLLNNGYLNAEQVNALVNGNAEDIAIVKEQLTQTVTSSQMQIEITKAIEGGVSYLKNTLFTIDENGMWIATSQDAFNALYNNKGMYLYSYEEMIAKFDVDGTTIEGNLTLEGEFITPNLRMMNVEVDGVAHTHIHWIGG